VLAGPMVLSCVQDSLIFFHGVWVQTEDLPAFWQELVRRIESPQSKHPNLKVPLALLRTSDLHRKAITQASEDGSPSPAFLPD
jgi:hypothetical protein